MNNPEQQEIEGDVKLLGTDEVIEEVEEETMNQQDDVTLPQGEEQLGLETKQGDLTDVPEEGETRREDAKSVKSVLGSQRSRMPHHSVKLSKFTLDKLNQTAKEPTEFGGPKSVVSQIRSVHKRMLSETASTISSRMVQEKV